MEIHDKPNKNYIEIWLTKEEQLQYNRSELTKMFLADKPAKYKAIFFLSGNSSLLDNTESLLIRNLAV